MQKTILSIEASPKSFDRTFDKLQRRMQSSLGDAFERRIVVRDDINSKCHEGHNATVPRPLLNTAPYNTCRLDLSTHEAKLQGKQELRANDNVAVRGPLIPMRSGAPRQLTSIDHCALSITERCEISKSSSFESAIDGVEKMSLHNSTPQDGVIKPKNSNQFDVGGNGLHQDVEDRSIDDTKLAKQISIKADSKDALSHEPAKDISANALFEASSRLSIQSISEREISILKKNQMQDIKKASSSCLKSSSDSCIANEKAISNNFCRNAVKFKEPEQNHSVQRRHKIIEKIQPSSNFKGSVNDQYDSDVSIDICELYDRPKRSNMHSSFGSSLSDMWRSSLSDFECHF